MKLRNKILLALLSCFVAIQFIQPVRNKTNDVLQSNLMHTYAVPDNVLALLQNSCYDCHSNNTRYPWYSFIQPGAWWMASHIRDGKAELNFSEFGKYSSRRQESKLKSVIDMIKDNSMPLASYIFLHRDARLNAEQKKILLDWLEIIKDSVSLKNY